jgi:hypothetical protein
MDLRNQRVTLTLVKLDTNLLAQKQEIHDSVGGPASVPIVPEIRIYKKLPPESLKMGVIVPLGALIIDDYHTFVNLIDPVDHPGEKCVPCRDLHFCIRGRCAGCPKVVYGTPASMYQEGERLLGVTYAVIWPR